MVAHSFYSWLVEKQLSYEDAARPYYHNMDFEKILEHAPYVLDRITAEYSWTLRNKKDDQSSKGTNPNFLHKIHDNMTKLCFCLL